MSQPRRMSHGEMVGRMKSAQAFPKSTEIIPPTGPDPRPTIIPGATGVSQYVYLLAAVAASTPDAFTELGGYAKTAEDKAQRIIDVTDALFDKLALKFSQAENV